MADSGPSEPRERKQAGVGAPIAASAAAPRVAVLIPCLNEAVSIGKVVADFRTALPDATVYVYDNNSKDDTMAVARAAGAVVRRETLRGKGSVMRRMFRDVEADVYVLVDGDDTYHAASAPGMIAQLLDDQLDMVSGARVTDIQAAYRPGHRFGNKFLTGMIVAVFGRAVEDMLSGYRVFSRRFVKSFPALSAGFETETELTVHALELRMPIAEVHTPYKERPPGSASKLRTIEDGLRILRLILMLIKEERPLAFFALCSVALLAASAVLAAPLFITYAATGLVPRMPTAVLATGLMLLGFLSLACGLILDTVTHGRREIKRLAYLALPGPPPPDTPA